MKKLLILLIIITVLILPCFGKKTNPAQGDKIVGVWLSDVKDVKVQVYRMGHTYRGKIIWLKHKGVAQNVPWLDTLNPNPKLRTRTRENIIALTGLVYKGKNKYNKGVIYYPTNGKTYKCTATLLNPDKLDLRFFVGISFVGKTNTFTRVK